MEMTTQHRRAVEGWVLQFCKPATSINKDYSTYRLKHKIEFDTGRYITEITLQRIFEDLGFDLKRVEKRTFVFARISKKALKPRHGKDMKRQNRA